MVSRAEGLPRWLGVALLAVGCSLAAAAVTVAVLVVLRPASDPLDSRESTTVAVRRGEVGASLALNVVAEWKAIPAGRNRAAGIVTAVSVAPGDEVGQGSALYAVDLRPVVIGRGEVPAFRAISEGVAGPDVAQLQQLLAELGLYSGPSDGTAGAQTVGAIRAWQKQLGVEPSGVVQIGDVIFVAALPARVLVDPEVVAVGNAVAGGERAVRLLPGEPEFGIPVTAAQAELVPQGTAVEITAPGGALWKAEVAGQRADAPSGTVVLALHPAAGGTICGEHCGQLPVTQPSRLPARVIVVPVVEGLVVPSAALVTGADGRTAVIDAGGSRHPVTVIASARGLSVIEGVAEGVAVRVPAKAAGG